MDRRDLLATAAGAVVASSFAALADEQKGPGPGKGEPAKVEPINAALHEAALACLKAGDICLDHCVRHLSSGSTMMAECAGTVRQMLPLCQAVAELAVQRAPRLKELAAVCAKACRDCEAACKKHAMHHAECKACLESCQRCAAECEKLA